MDSLKGAWKTPPGVFKIINRRTHLSFWRFPNYGFTRVFNHVAIDILTGLTFLQLDDSRSSLQERIFVIFEPMVLPAIIVAQVEPKYNLSRSIVYRGSAAKAYKQFPFALSMVLAEMPHSILCAVGFFFSLYYMPRFQSASSRAGYEFLIILITQLYDRPVICSPSQLNTFTPPSGQTCGQFMDSFFSNGGAGYHVNNATDVYQCCAYRVGDRFCEPLGYEFDHRWRNRGIYAAFIGSNLIVLFLGSRYLNFTSSYAT